MLRALDPGPARVVVSSPPGRALSGQDATPLPATPVALATTPVALAAPESGAAAFTAVPAVPAVTAAVPVPDWPLTVDLGEAPASEGGGADSTSGGGSSGGRSSARARAARELARSVVSITEGLCSDHRASDGETKVRGLSLRECDSYARLEGAGRSFIGANAEPKEFAGCVLWERRFVEFNSAGSLTVPCSLSKQRGQCLCYDASLASSS